VKDVHAPELAKSADLGDHPGFDPFFRRPNGSELAIEVKGRVQTSDINISENEWGAACNQHQKYWLYIIFDCANSTP
jgi:hypothetical protein